METIIVEYRPTDKPELIRLIEMLQDYLTTIDPLHRLRRLPEFGRLYTEALLKKINDQSGVIYLATKGREAIGSIAGVIEEQDEVKSAGTIPSKSGRILELIIREDCRGEGIGKMLMQKLEHYFRSRDCDIVRVEVFAPNTNAYSFYTGLGYYNRTTDMVKTIQK
jgi:ribosomal protein S18 acetylase RimI-like enzyme